MEASITLYRVLSRRLERQVQQHCDALLVRRILAVLYLADGQSVSVVARRLASHSRVRLLFQPAWHPWVNRIERLWKTLHDTVTRIHTYTSMDALIQAVTRFMTVAQPWPGNRHALALQV